MTAAQGRSLRGLESRGVGLLKGVGPRKVDALAQMGISSVLDLLTHYPRRYIDRTKERSIAEMGQGEEAMVLARVRGVSTRRLRGGRTMVTAELTDGTAYLRCSFFNQPWRAKQLSGAGEVVVFGQLDTYRGRRQMTNPVVDLVGDKTGRIVAVYPQSERSGLSTWELGGWIEEALKRAGEIADPLPEEIRLANLLADRTSAFWQIHNPSSMKDQQRARRRLAFDELLRLQLALVMRKAEAHRRQTGIRHRVGRDEPSLVGRFHASMRERSGGAFALTGAQQRALEEIGEDMASPHPMHRLLHGDVGSGKTLVAVDALLTAVQGGHQGALMAPTEVLAEQHFAVIGELVAGLTVPDRDSLLGQRPLSLALLTNRTPASERSSIHADLRAGRLDVLVGTHALLTEEVAFASLGLVVVDEQHRFGVEQRAALRAKGGPGPGDPDMLVMTATPIPRTAAMTVYGDLDTTVLDELPAGRTPVDTVWARSQADRELAWRRVREEVEAGHPAYVVCPLVEESEQVQARSATEERDRLAAGPLKGLEVGLLHGQMPGRDKQQVMEEFRTGRTPVLVATTVVEVGVDVPDATVMVIEDADRFGVAQLHQLRGRVGRGSLKSWCYLLADPGSPEAVQRLEALERSNDGFELAEVDLELRGEGTILGTLQKGRSDLKLASLRRDRELVALARGVAEEMLASDPGLAANPLLADEIRLTVGEDEEEYLFKG